MRLLIALALVFALVLILTAVGWIIAWAAIQFERVHQPANDDTNGEEIYLAREVRAALNAQEGIPFAEALQIHDNEVRDA